MSAGDIRTVTVIQPLVDQYVNVVPLAAVVPKVHERGGDARSAAVSESLDTSTRWAGTRSHDSVTRTRSRF